MYPERTKVTELAKIMGISRSKTPYNSHNKIPVTKIKYMIKEIPAVSPVL
jgi:cystathionine beta-lyase family protein involved in aluminum resistance